MDYNQINEMLEKYWEGETSLAEEGQLKKYFQSERIAPDHQRFAPMFQWIDREEEKLLVDHFEEVLLEKLATPQIAKRRTLVFYLGRVAAAIALVAGMWLFYQNKNYYSQDQVAELTEEEILEAKAAYLQVKEALFLISDKMNKGTDTAREGIYRFDQATNKVRQK